MTDKSAGEALLPCPFCKASASKVFNGRPMHGHYVMCLSCNSTTRMCATPDEAIAAWNLRASPQPSEPAALVTLLIDFITRAMDNVNVMRELTPTLRADWEKVDFAIRMREAEEPAAPVAAGDFAAAQELYLKGRDTLLAAQIREDARTAHPEPAAAEPVEDIPVTDDEITRMRNGYITYGDRVCISARMLTLLCDAVRMLRRANKKIASAPSQPSEGPARVTDAMVEAGVMARLRVNSDAHDGYCIDTMFIINRELLMKEMRAALEAALAAAGGKVTDADLVIGLQLALCQMDIDKDDLDTARKHAALIADRRAAAEGK